MTQILTDIANDPSTKWERNTGAPAMERALRVIQGCAMLALAANMTNLTAFGQTFDLKRVNSFVGTVRFGIFAHFSIHDVLDACASKIQVEPNTNRQELLLFNALILSRFLHEQGVINLGSQSDMISSSFRLLWFKLSICGAHSAIKAWRTEETEKGDYKLAHKAILASLDLFVWMPFVLFEISKDLRHLGALYVIVGGYGAYVRWNSDPAD